MLISESYKEQIRFLHEKQPGWGSANKHKATISSMITACQSQDILDYGCGTGELGKSLPFAIKEYDPGIPGKDTAPEPADIVICSDVLEHVEPEFVDNVLFDLQRCVKKMGLFQISTRTAKEFLPDGRNAHLTLMNWDWWVRKIGNLFHITSLRMDHYLVGGGQDIVIIVTPSEK